MCLHLSLVSIKCKDEILQVHLASENAHYFMYQIFHFDVSALIFSVYKVWNRDFTLNDCSHNTFKFEPVCKFAFFQGQ